MKLAAIDIGSNSIHMVVVEANGRSIDIIDREKAMVKLGANAFRTRKLSSRAFEAGIDTVRRFVKLADGLGADDIVAVATSATRETENGGQFLSAIGAATGVEPRVISGTEEARLIYRAVRNALQLGDQKVLVLDIGGGSVEAVLGDARNILMSDSMKLGVQRLRDLFGEEPLGAKRRKRLGALIDRRAQPILDHARSIGFTRVVGTSGTIRGLAQAAHKAGGGERWRSLNAETARLKDIRKVAERLATLPRSGRATVRGVDEERTDTIHLGGVLLVRLLELLEATEITLCDASLREGVILEHLAVPNTSSASYAGIPDVRYRSVAQLARRYGQNESRQRHVANLALQIFDQTRALHHLSDRPRAELEYAALLSTIGQHIAFKGYQAHSAYIIENAGLRGFSDDEVSVIADIVRFHRKALPSKRDLTAHSKADRKMIRTLAAILRVAIGLDRTSGQLVKRVRCSHRGRMLRLTPTGDGDLELEIWAARRHSAPLGKALGVDIEVERAADDPSVPPALDAGPEASLT